MTFLGKFDHRGIPLRLNFPGEVLSLDKTLSVLLGVTQRRERFFYCSILKDQEA
jgi:hypothetical protein